MLLATGMRLASSPLPRGLSSRYNTPVAFFLITPTDPAPALATLPVVNLLVSVVLMEEVDAAAEE